MLVGSRDIGGQNSNAGVPFLQAVAPSPAAMFTSASHFLTNGPPFDMHCTSSVHTPRVGEDKYTVAKTMRL